MIRKNLIGNFRSFVKCWIYQRAIGDSAKWVMHSLLVVWQVTWARASSSWKHHNIWNRGSCSPLPMSIWPAYQRVSQPAADLDASRVSTELVQTIPQFQPPWGSRQVVFHFIWHCYRHALSRGDPRKQSQDSVSCLPLFVFFMLQWWSSSWFWEHFV